MIDVTLLNYILILLMSCFNFCLYVYWLKQADYKASAWFYYVVILFAANAIIYSIGTYARVIYLIDPHNLAAFKATLWWPFKNILLTGVMGLITIHSVWKYFFSNR